MRAWFAFAALLCSRDVLACAPAPHAGEFVAVVEESAVIIWEPATKTEHFIRRASFRGEARDFGFLVPTPTVPVLTRVDDGVFSHLAAKTVPATVHETRKRIDWTPLLLLPFLASSVKDGAPATTAARAPVEVLSTQRVGGYEAAILDATDAAALSRWLETNGYATTPDLTAWLDVYVQQRWILSAFKIDKDASVTDAMTSAVRMSFTTERPFFPYREPASQREGPSDSRVLRVWFVGPERVRGTIGADGAWPGQLFWSDALRDLELGGVSLTGNERLTAFEDHETPRPGVDDLFFVRDPDQGKVLPPPQVITETETTNVPLDVVLAPVLIGGWWWRRRVRRTTRPGTPPPAPPGDSADRNSDA